MAGCLDRAPGRAVRRGPAAARRTSIVLSPIAARRDVDDPLEADAVRVGAQDPQVRQRVLDLAPGVEPRPADELVADAVAEERFLDRAGLGVHPVHDRDVAGPEPGVGLVVVRAAGQGAAATADQALDLAGDPLGLLLLVVGLEALDLDAAGVLRPELLVLARAVARDDRVGGVEDQLRRAVVLLELDDRRLRASRARSRGCCAGRRRATSRSTGRRRRRRAGCGASRRGRGPTGTAPGSCPGTRRRGGSATSPGTWRARRAPRRTAGRPRAGGRRSRARWPCAGAPGSGSRAGRSSARGGSRPFSTRKVGSSISFFARLIAPRTALGRNSPVSGRSSSRRICFISACWSSVS